MAADMTPSQFASLVSQQELQPWQRQIVEAIEKLTPDELRRRIALGLRRRKSTILRISHDHR